METTINKVKSKDSKQLNFSWLYENRELIAAIFSAIIILFAWIFKANLAPWLWITIHIVAFIIGGYAQAKEGILDTIENRELNVELLMILAAIGSVAIGFWTEGAILIIIFALAGALETYTLNKSNKEISSLMTLQPEEASLISDGAERTVPVSELKVGDIIFVKASERIPADGMITKGATGIDESAITGESVPVSKTLNEEVLAGTVALDGSISVEITKPTSETLFQKIIEMVQSAQDEKSPSQLFIERFEGTYVKIVLAVVLVMMFLPYLAFGWTLTESIYRAMVLLVVASPCALVASIMPATLAAISKSARNGVLFKGGVHAENLSNIKAIAFDKTGTLTNGTPIVTDTIIATGLNGDLVIPIVGAIEKESTHPLAKAINDFSLEYSQVEVHNIDVHDMKTISGHGVSATIDGEEWIIGNAAFIGPELAYSFQDGIAKELASQGKTITFALKNGEVAALFALKDTIRKVTINAIAALKKQGIYTVMLTGDNEITAKAVADEIGIDHYIGECLPDQKVKYVKELRDKYKIVAMVGDGINDAPALATSNVGIAMGEGTDVALETADVVLMKNDLTRITSAIELSSKMNRVVKQNVYFSLSVILLLIIGNFLQAVDLPLGVIGHEGSTILVILNGLRLLR